MERDMTSTRLSPPATSEADHFFVCHCGEAVDMREIEQVVHHETASHTPTPTN